MNEARLKEDRLASNALVAFVGALLVGQTWACRKALSKRHSSTRPSPFQIGCTSQ